MSTSEPSVLIFNRQGKNPIWQLDFNSGSIALKSADREEFGLLKAVHMAEQVIIKARRDGKTFKITSVGP